MEQPEGGLMKPFPLMWKVSSGPAEGGLLGQLMWIVVEWGRE